MRKACVAIGVNEVRDVSRLPKLQAAGTGALEFAEWAKSSDPTFETECLTDDKGPVALADVKKAVFQIVNSQSYDQLVIYFAGHGILKSWDTELWLLSNAAGDPNEAVNLVGSIRYARNSGIPHVLFVSDACRSVTADGRLGQVDGSIIFPIRNVVRQRPPEIDSYYASLPGDPSYEVEAAEAGERYDGVFTKCLLEGLKGLTPALREKIQEDRGAVEVVSSRSLKPWLEEKVQDTITAVSIQLNQLPEVRVESQPPKYLTRVPPLAAGAERGSGAPLPSAISAAAALRTVAEDNGLHKYFLKEGEIESRLIARARPKTKFNGEMDRLLSAKGRRESSGTQTGFTVIGGEVASVFVDGRARGSEVFLEGDVQQIRVHEDSPGQSALIVFGGGRGTCLAILPGYIATVVLETNVVVNVSYTLSHTSPRWQEYERVREDLEKRRAFTAVAARQGIFRIDRDSAGSFADYIRELKAIDPTLGIYAAYAYSQSGLTEQVKGVLQWMSVGGEIPVPFDVALLADQLDRPAGRRGFRYAPQGPMLTQGWSLLHEGLPIPGWLLAARRHTLPALWTTFTPDGAEFVRKMLAKGVR